MKILLVDDHPLILEALRHVLRQLEGEVDVLGARTAEDGVALVAAHPDAGLLLLDLTLPGSDGFALLETLRRDHPQIPVVVLSASDRREDILRAIDLGAMGYIPKTSSNQVTLQALRLVLSGGVYLPPVALNLRDEVAGATRDAAPVGPACDSQRAWPDCASVAGACAHSAGQTKQGHLS